MSASKRKPPGHRYRVVNRLNWIEGGRPAPAPKWWEGGEVVIYEPGETVYVDDRELSGIYHKLEAIDDAGRVVLEEIRVKAEGPAQRTPVADLDAEQRSALACLMARKRIEQGEGLKEALIWAIRNGINLPDDFEFRAWFADALEGKLDPKRGRGRPRKGKENRRNDIWDYVRKAMEHGMAEAYDRWLTAFQRDRDLAWLRSEALRLHEEQPDAACWCRPFDLYEETGRRAYSEELTALGARPCPKTLRGAKTARELALKATAREYKQRWRKAGGGELKSSAVARIVSRAKKSE